MEPAVLVLIGGARPGPRRRRLIEGRDLRLSCLAVERVARLFDRPVERLPDFADHLSVGGDSAFGRHSKGMGLHAHVGGKFALALSGAIIPDGTVEVLVAGIVCSLGRGVARLRDRPAIELAAP